MENMKQYTKDITVLYIEDNQEERELISDILSHMFDNIIVATDGEDGLNKFEENKIDLVLTDIHMPNLDGLSMLKIIKEEDYEVYVGLITALEDFDILLQAIDIGVNVFINKPISNIKEFHTKIFNLVKMINFHKHLKEIERLNQKQEEVSLILDFLHSISHQWRQPLSVISTISSYLSLKLKDGAGCDEKDYQMLDDITQQTQKLSDIFVKLENIRDKKVELKDINQIIKVSNPLYC